MSAKVWLKVCASPTCDKPEGKPLDEFYRDLRHGDGRAYRCKKCSAAKDRGRYARDPEKFRARERARYAKDPEKIRAQKRASRAKDPEKRRAQRNALYAKDPEKFRARERARYAKDPEKIRAQRRARYARKKNVNSPQAGGKGELQMASKNQARKAKAAKKRAPKRESPELTFEIRRITPAIATGMLADRQKNRAVSKSRVTKLAKAMKAKEWELTQPILISNDGRVIDGQHRLEGVVKSNVTCTFCVITGYDYDLMFRLVDDTYSRKLHHHLEIVGEDSPALLASVIRKADAYERGVIPFSNNDITAPYGFAFLEKHPELRRSVKAPGTRNEYAKRPMCCFLHWAFAKKDKALADSFFTDLVMGEDEGDGDPIYVLRSRLKSNKHAKAKLTQTEVGALIIKAWNAVRTGSRVKNLRWRTAGKGSEHFPEVI